MSKLQHKVLFVCIHNSARSQMAEAFLNKYGKGEFEAESAGIEPGHLNPVVVKVKKAHRESLIFFVKVNIIMRSLLFVMLQVLKGVPYFRKE
jgi:predicted protein tyrosine phosphatase